MAKINKKAQPAEETTQKSPKAFKKGKGRPSGISPEITEEVCKYLRQGNYIETAAAMVDISKPTLYDWLKKGNREEKGIYRDFLNAVKKAQTQAEVSDVLTIAKASQHQWQAAAWRLERKFPGKWGRNLRVEMDELDKNDTINNLAPEEEKRVNKEYDLLIGNKMRHKVPPYPEK